MLEIKNLSLYYGDKNVLNNVNLAVAKGECILFTGESGSGKTSIINSINGLAIHYGGGRLEGEILLDGQDLTMLKLYEVSLHIASVFQNPKTHFFNVNTTLELLFYLENIGLSRDEMNKRLSDVLDVFPIKHLLGRSIFELSGGEKQIISIASAYISGCRVITLDEPSSNLDQIHIDILAKMLTKLKSKGITLIISEHRLYYLMNVVDRVFRIVDGRVTKEFSKNEFSALKAEQLKEYGLRCTRIPKLVEDLTVPQKIAHSPSNLLVKSLVCKFKGGSNPGLHLSNLGFEFGRIYGIIGKNGCGKSTFVRNLIGLVRNPHCNVKLNGSDFSRRKRLKSSALVMQDVNHQLFSDAVMEELKLGIKDFDYEEARKILYELGLLPYVDRHPLSLSGGQKQRVAIASTLCKKSTLMFFDEPTSGMDYRNMVKISKIIKATSKSDNIIFIVSHDVEFLNLTVDGVIDLTRE